MKFLASLLSPILLFTILESTAQGYKNVGTGEMDPEKSILKNTEASKDYKTLLAAMRATDLDELLRHDGPFTVFAPSDMAFRKLPANTIRELLRPENKERLRALMTYHIVAGDLSASKILREMCRGKGRATFKTVHGDEITATLSGIDIVLTDVSGNAAKITVADSDQCNGVIHQIDSVILPGKL